MASETKSGPDRVGTIMLGTIEFGFGFVFLLMGNLALAGLFGGVGAFTLGAGLLGK